MLKVAVLLLPFGLAMGLPAVAGAAAPPLVDLSVQDRAECPASKSSVTMAAGAGHGQVGFTIYRDGEYVQDGLLSPNSRRTVKVKIPPDAASKISVQLAGQGTANYTVESHCRARLPFTGPATRLYGRLATAIGLLITGAIFWWYAGIWPRQTR
ncbi:hypothetical protein Aph01nite_53620 [Acrocarpospora phusangensis]|uniref:Uncharacterized protein n=1 Tax=Acrocarpospora phusangensis TaxID=1070424 RepID=A0A919QDP7_9ACTN|nr:hypothetical protein [Acrocarpospora phusangensis]GIH27052.1 hypothetical protein Aph01nite_53620 [Acrocarpospora phusangensis]